MNGYECHNLVYSGPPPTPPADIRSLGSVGGNSSCEATTLNTSHRNGLPTLRVVLLADWASCSVGFTSLPFPGARGPTLPDGKWIRDYTVMSMIYDGPEPAKDNVGKFISAEKDNR